MGEKTDESGSKSKKLRWLLAFLLVSFALGAVSIWVVSQRMQAGTHRGLTQCLVSLKNIGVALEMYSTDWDGQYPRKLEQLTPVYLKTIPSCAAAGLDTYSEHFSTGVGAGFNEGENEDYYFIECHGEYHKPLGIRANFPAYDSVGGLYERGP